MGQHLSTEERERIALLSNGQRECLRLVLLHMSSKDIARKLGISPHTVDQRLKVATRRLGVNSRVEAARRLADHEGTPTYQSTLYQSPGLADGDELTTLLPLIDYRELQPTEHADNYVRDIRDQHLLAPSLFGLELGLPLPANRGGRNDLSIAQKLGWIFALAVIAALAFGMILAGLDALARLV